MKVKTKLISFYSETQTEYDATIITIDKKEYLSVPVVMMMEGVHNGSRGPLLHLAEELGNPKEPWDNIPVTISHPVNDDNEYVSVNSEQLKSEEWVVGVVINTVLDDKKLKATLLLDVQKLAAISPETLQSVQDGEIVEVSVGVFSEEEEKEGKFNGEEYITVSRNYVPDHLALLPEEVGACSIDDGCGLRINKNEKGGNDLNIYEKLKEQNLTISPIVNEVSFDDIRDQVWGVLSTLEVKDVSYTYLDAIYENYFVYRKRVRVDGGDFTDGGLFKQNYSVGADNKVTKVGDPVEVKKEVSYITLQDHIVRRRRVKNNKSKNMCEKCEQKVNELIAHSSTHFNESDRVWLADLTEDKLDKLVPKKVTPPVKSELTVDTAWEFIQANTSKAEDYIAKLPEPIKSQVEAGITANKEKIDILVTSIMDNTEKDVWTKEKLEAMDLETLQSLEKSVNKEPENYSGGAGGGGSQLGEDEVAPMPLPGVTFKN